MSKSKIPDFLKKELRQMQNNEATGKAICYLSGLDIEEDDIEYDHVIPEINGGTTDISNVRIICAKLNRRKGSKNLSDFKEQLIIENLFKEKEVNLSDLLVYKKINNKSIKLNFDENYAHFGENSYKLFYCTKTNSKYFFARISYEYIVNDFENGLQPRNIDVKKLLELKENFQNRPQLQPSIARLKNEKILLFDGQHKAAANLLNGAKDLELKIYIDDKGNDDLFQQLMITNLEAHNKFKQTGFASSILMNKMKNVADSHFEEYMNTDREIYSEKGYLEFLVDVKRFKRNEAESIIKSSILEAQIDSFGIKELIIDRVEFDTSKKGISHSTFKRLLQAKLCYQNLISDDFNKGFRENENANFNIITSMFKKHSKNKSETFIKRFLNPYSLQSVLSLLKDLIIIICEVVTESDRNRLLMNLELKPDGEAKIQKCIDYIYSHVIWLDESNNDVWKLRGSSPLTNYFEKNRLTVKDILLAIK